MALTNPFLLVSEVEKEAVSDRNTGLEFRGEPRELPTATPTSFPFEGQSGIVGRALHQKGQEVVFLLAVGLPTPEVTSARDRMLVSLTW